MIEIAALAIVGVIFGFHIWSQGRRARVAEEQLRELQHEYRDVLLNMVKYGQATKPVATVTDPGPIDDETRVIHAIHTRAVDKATDYISEEGQVSPERAREEAEKLISAFETRGQPE